MDEKKTFRAQATDALNAADECVSGFDKIAIIERAIRAAWESGYADSAEHLESQRALGRAAVQRAERAETHVAELEDDRQRAFKVGYQVTLNCQTLEEMTSHLVELVRKARAEREAAEQRAAKAEAQERYLTERIHGTAQGGGLVREVEVLKKCLFAQQEAAFLEVAKAKAAEARVAELEARVVDLEHALPASRCWRRRCGGW